MEIEEFVEKKKELYSTLLDFIETSDDFENELSTLIQVFEKQEILQDRVETLNLFNLISTLEENHYRTVAFYEKFEQLFNYIIKEKQFSISNSDLFQIYKNNKRMLLLLLEKNFLIPDELILAQIFQMNDLNRYPYPVYLYSGIKPYLNESQRKEIEREINNYHFKIDDFIKKCQKGENDLYVCELIRQDSIEEFISYVTQTNFPLSTKIKKSIFETHNFLMAKKPSLIKYATFFGSVQIVQFLKFNKVKLRSKLWYYAVHSNVPELIHFCEENKIEKKDIRNRKYYYERDNSEDKNNLIILDEAVKCHHNDIYSYFRNNILSQDIEKKNLNHFEIYIIDLYNYNFYPDDICDMISMKKKKYVGFNISFLCTSIKKITIPSSVAVIGNSAFNGCSSVKEVVISSSVKRIGDDAFSDCTSLEKLTISPSVVKIGNDAFKGCTSLLELVIPSSVTSIGCHAFECCSSLVEVSIPESVSQIKSSLFYGCSSLERINLPLTVTSLGDYCFGKCTSLKEIEIPSSVEKIGKHAFEYCESLIQVTIPEKVRYIEDCAFKNCTLLKHVSIPLAVYKIGNFAFYECQSLEDFTASNSVTHIGKFAFDGCISLKQITFPSLLSFEEENAFPSTTKVQYKKS
ncbi:hypothetical protein M9Y10_014856 [Tritrichomonas musculus]|uniref:Uncharacterized protein n=1 Tax=Tritrichomonas musculus TaxID=1915356 RepID=A0ABR2L3W1_9EUKA